jgi:2-amino-4-hydroxy-6-hydroxymethyldihydropteridine diphosphokinase
METVYLLLGSNLNEPEKQMAIAEKMIGKKVGRITRKSSLYKTAAWGLRDQPDFLNRVVICQTKLLPWDILQTILAIEKDMGRNRGKKNAPRIIDIDILFYGKEIINDQDLQVPHPRISERRFVLVPLNEVSPMFKHPVLNKSINKLLKECRDPLDVKRI